MVRLMIFALFIGALGFIAFQMINFFFSISGTKGQQRRDLEKLRDKLNAILEELVPMSDEELSLLSSNHEVAEKSVGVSAHKAGVIKSIYGEPLLAYAYQKYGLNGDRSIGIVKSTNGEYVYFSEGERTKIEFNSHEIGVVNSDGKLYGYKNRDLLGELHVDDVLRTFPVIINGRECGEMLNFDLASSPNPRVYEFIEPMDADESMLFKSLTYLLLLEQIVLK